MSTKNTLIVITIALVVLSAGWYFSSIYVKRLQAGLQEDSGVASDTTTSIVRDISQVPGDSSLEEGIDSLNKDLESF